MTEEYVYFACIIHVYVHLKLICVYECIHHLDLSKCACTSS